MDFDDVKRHFGGAVPAARALGLKSRQAIYEWKAKGIPYLRQLDIERRTGGALKAEKIEPKRKATEKRPAA